MSKLESLEKMVERIIHEYKYPAENVKIEQPFQVGQAKFIPDVLVYLNNKPHIVAEVVPYSSFKRKKGQMFSYLVGIGAEYAMLTDGVKDQFYHRSNEKIEPIFDLPLYGKSFETAGSLSKQELVKATDIRHVFRKIYEKLLEDELSPVRAFEEMTKLVLSKLYDERGDSEECIFRAQYVESPVNVSTRIRTLFSKSLEKEFSNIFDIGEDISISEHSLKNIVGFIQKYSLSESGRGYLSNFLHETLRSELGQFYTPAPIAEFLIELLNPAEGDSILDLACGIGEILSLASKKKSKLFGIEISPTIARLARLNLFLGGALNAKIFTHDALTPLKRLSADVRQFLRAEEFDFVVVDPPAGKVVSDPNVLGDYLTSSGKRSQYSTALFLEQGLRLLKPGGMMAAIVPDGILTNSSTIRVRKHIAERVVILAVISLPREAFLPFSGIKTSILLMKKLEQEEDIIAQPVVFFSMAKKLSDLDVILADWKTRQKKTEASFKKSFTARAETNRLDAEFYHSLHSDSLTSLRQSPFEKCRLGVIASCISGLKPSRLQAGKMEVAYVRGKNVVDLSVDIRSASKMEVDAKEIKEYSLQDGDILLTRVGTVGRVGIVREPDESAIFSDNVVRIRLTGGIDPYYVLSFLESDYGKEQIRLLTTGTTIKGISLSNVASIEIPLLPEDARNSISTQMRQALKAKDDAALFLRKARYSASQTMRELLS